jgi:excisionase family DNA binding protein
MRTQTPVPSDAAPRLVLREHMTPEQAAEYLGVSLSWLAGSRVRGDGPPFYKLGRIVRYQRSVLDEWTRTRQVRSTSEASAASP